MKVLLAASEVYPFAKTGGLADVAAGLPRALDRLGVEAAICLPYYRKVRGRNDAVEVVADRVSCPFAGSNRPFRLLRTTMPGSPGVAVYFIENHGMFEAEDALYGTEPGSYGDGHLRFLYFSRALMRLPKAIDWYPDVIHVNDWQTALVPALLRTVHRHDDKLSKAACVLTIHNMAYQGVFTTEELAQAGLPSFLLEDRRLLEDGSGNLLAGGIRFADAISTVSRTYAQEILTEEYGNGLEAVLHWRRDLLVGIVNGLDTETWDPATDPHLARQYDSEDLSGKDACKRALLEKCGLQPTDGPVFGVVSRLVAQKGLGLILPVMDRILGSSPDARLVVLGSGEPDLERAFTQLARTHEGRAFVNLAFDPVFSSLVEAGADLFLMPSKFEPCGLNQLISMRYGTPPIVRGVGGLRDTVTNADARTLKDDTATGFTFDLFTAPALEEAVGRALRLYTDDPEAFRRMRLSGMNSDWSWNRSAREYLKLYETARKRALEPDHIAPLLEGLSPEPLELDLPLIATVPETYDRNVLLLLPQAPGVLFCHWELEHATFAENPGASVELVLHDQHTQERHGESVEDTGWRLRDGLIPGRSYTAEIWLHTPGQAARKLLEHGPITLPDDIWPEDL